MEGISNHFSKLAPKYRELRTTDVEPIYFINNYLKDLSNIIAADIGCGSGRYDVEFFGILGEKLRQLICIDNNEKMLNELTKNMKENDIDRFTTINASATDLPLDDDSMDVLFAFNAIHHFELSIFLEEASRVLRENGLLFIYTRLMSQNRRTIWGKFFPSFNEKESRLYELEALKGGFEKASNLVLETVEYFKYKRVDNLERLVTQASHHHYSTFYFYGKDEFGEALKEFKKTIADNFEDTDMIVWYAENTMLVGRQRTLNS